MKRMRLASLSNLLREVTGTGLCIAWKVITGTVNIGFEKRETTPVLKMSLAPLHGIQVTSPINVNLMENKTNIYRQHSKKLLSPSGARYLNTALPTRLMTDEGDPLPQLHNQH